MREILFRGKRIDNGKWIEGWLVSGEYYLNNNAMTVIFPKEPMFYPHYEVNYYEPAIPETVGQWTGLVDVNGTKIFEGDIIKLDNSLDTKQKNFEVKFAYGQFYIGINKPIAYVRNSCEIIGNIHDNPELLEEK